MCKGVLECTECLGRQESMKVWSRRDSPHLVPKVQEKTVLGSGETIRKKSHGFTLGEDCSLSHREKGFSSSQFLQETKLELDIKLRSISFPVPLCQLRVTHPLDLSSSTTSSRKFSLTLPPRSELLFYVYKAVASCATFLSIVILHLFIWFISLSRSLEWILPVSKNCLVLQLLISLRLACHIRKMCLRYVR